MSKEMFEVWSANRTIKKAFLSEPVLTAVTAKANALGIDGRILVLERSGSEVSDDETLEYLAKKSFIFILLNETLQWTPHNCQSSVTADINSQKDHPDPPAPTKHLRSTSMTTYPHIPEIMSSHSKTNLESPAVAHLPILEPLRIISPALSSSSSTRNSSLQLFSNFAIPWDSLPDDVLEKLRNKRWLGNRIHAFIKEVVKNLRRTSFHIPAKIYRCIAESIVEKYPESFLQEGDINRKGSSASEMLLVMMRNHNNYLNSAASKEGSARAPPKKRKRKYVHTHRKNAKTQDRADITKKMQRSLKNSYPKNKLMTQARDKILCCMEECFEVLRSYLNKPGSYPSIKDIQKDWPYLFNKECILSHFLQLTEVSYAKICDDYQAEKRKLRDYFAKQSDIKGLETDDFALLLALSAYFEEDMKYVIQKFPRGTALEDILVPVAGPWIAVLESSLDLQVGYIFIESKLIWTEKRVDVFDMLVQCIAYFFSFNIEYPDEMSQSLDFIVRYFLNHFPDIYKGPHSNINNMSKINNLIEVLTAT